MKTTKTKFGLKQLDNPTPVWAKRLFRVFFYTSGIVTIAMQTFSDIPPEVTEVVSRYIVEANLAVHALTKMFGVSPEID